MEANSKANVLAAMDIADLLMAKIVTLAWSSTSKDGESIGLFLSTLKDLSARFLESKEHQEFAVSELWLHKRVDCSISQKLSLPARQAHPVIPADKLNTQ